MPLPRHTGYYHGHGSDAPFLELLHRHLEEPRYYHFEDDQQASEADPEKRIG